MMAHLIAINIRACLSPTAGERRKTILQQNMFFSDHMMCLSCRNPRVCYRYDPCLCHAPMDLKPIKNVMSLSIVESHIFNM